MTVIKVKGKVAFAFSSKIVPPRTPHLNSWLAEITLKVTGSVSENATGFNFVPAPGVGCCRR